jgi:hypothetical protein
MGLSRVTDIDAAMDMFTIPARFHVQAVSH